jgi:8-oxo-dGTP pyrophosphatase MutT (NUDIX family)
MAFDIPRGVVLSVSEIDVMLDPKPHPFERENEAAIARNWQLETSENPALFNGTVVLLSKLSYADRRLSGRCHAVTYATFLYWRRNRLTAPAEHSFAHAVLVSSDGALIAVRMGQHTANAGRVYFAAGSFEPADFRDGMVDLHFNMAREVREETGLDISAVPRDEAYHAYSSERGTVIFRGYYLAESAEDIAARIRDFVASDSEPEIEGPVIIRNASDLPDGLMPHMRPLIDWYFSGLSAENHLVKIQQ